MAAELSHCARVHLRLSNEPLLLAGPDSEVGKLEPDGAPGVIGQLPDDFRHHAGERLGDDQAGATVVGEEHHDE